MLQLVHALLTQLGFVTTMFWLWMIYECFQCHRDRQKWLRVILFLHIIGALLYFIARWLPQNSLPTPRWMHRWTRQGELQQAEAEVIAIGKAHQFVKLGNLLYDMGDRSKSLVAYKRAIDQEPNHPKALWGMACIEFDRGDLATAKVHLQALLAVSPQFNYGDASLLYGHVLFQLNEFNGAITHLESHLQYWSSPEAHLLMAMVQQRQGDRYAARNTLETMLCQIRSSTPVQYRRHRGFLKQGQRMLRGLTR